MIDVQEIKQFYQANREEKTNLIEEQYSNIIKYAYDELRKSALAGNRFFFITRLNFELQELIDRIDTKKGELKSLYEKIKAKINPFDREYVESPNFNHYLIRAVFEKEGIYVFSVDGIFFVDMEQIENNSVSKSDESE